MSSYKKKCHIIKHSVKLRKEPGSARIIRLMICGESPVVLYISTMTIIWKLSVLRYFTLFKILLLLQNSLSFDRV